MCGLPASGKSKIANQYRDIDYVVLSSDELREELYGDVANQNNNTDLFTELYRRARHQLYLGNDVVVDATNLVSKRRILGLESILKNTKKDAIEIDRGSIHVAAEIIACPYNECIDRNKSRDRKVPNSVIESMYKQWQTPMIQEGFDEVRLNYTSDTMLDVNEEIEFLKSIPQFNKNHNLTIGEHCRKVADDLLIKTNYIGYILFCAGILHDIGKLFCMQFKDSNGKTTHTAHFYNHESVSAYDSLFYFREGVLTNLDRIKTSQLITWHMLPHRLETQKSIDKYKKFLGDEFYNDLMLLHEADKNGRE